MIGKPRFLWERIVIREIIDACIDDSRRPCGWVILKITNPRQLYERNLLRAAPDIDHLRPAEAGLLRM